MNDNKELIEALNQIEKEKDIKKEVLIEAIKNSILAACKNQFEKSENIDVIINSETGAVDVFAKKTIVEDVNDDRLEITLDEAQQKFPKKKLAIGDIPFRACGISSAIENHRGLLQTLPLLCAQDHQTVLPDGHQMLPTKFALIPVNFVLGAFYQYKQ